MLLRYGIRTIFLMLLFCSFCIYFIAVVSPIHLSNREFMSLTCLVCDGKQQQTHKGIHLPVLCKQTHVLLHTVYFSAYFRIEIRILTRSNGMTVLLFTYSCFFFHILSFAQKNVNTCPPSDRGSTERATEPSS